MSLKSRILALGLALALVAAPAGMPKVSACPSCKEAVATQGADEARRLSTGYFYSILLMIAMPLTIFSTGAFVIHRAVKRGALPEL